MTSRKYLGLLLILPLFTMALSTAYVFDPSAISAHADRNLVCGDRLCSEIVGGRVAYEAASSVTSKSYDRASHMMDDDHIDDKRMSQKDCEKYIKDHMMMDKDHMKDDKMMMDKDHMKDRDHMDKDYMKDDKMMMDKDHMKDRDHMDKDYMKDDKMMMDKDHMKDRDHMDKDHSYKDCKKYMKDHMMMDKDHMKDRDHMDKDHMMDDKMMMDKDHMKDKDHMDSAMESGMSLRLSRANVATDIPLHHGYFDGGDVYYIITDSSDKGHADIITEKQNWQVELAPLLANTPSSVLSTTYFFANGVDGDGIHGYQDQVFSSTPAQAESYSGLTSHVHVAWSDNVTPSVLTSEQDIISAQQENKVVLTNLEVVLNMPHIVWPDGQMLVKEDKTLTDDTPYGGGQVLDIDTESMTVTFIAHRGWGPDGRSIYYIVTDATPSGPAQAMGVVHSPTSADLLVNSAAVDLFQFGNGIAGSGPLGFQPGIAAGAPGDENYSPMWRIFVANWDDPATASVLETVGDVSYYRSSGAISVDLARPMDSDHIVNCPFIDPFQ